MSTTAKVSPMMKQYLDIKQKNKDKLLLFRVGDFFELFFDDAKIVSRELNLTLTSRSNKIPMCGVPHRAIESYIAKLIQKGYKVIICDQVEDPKLTKTLVKREITSIITPGTVTDLLMLPEKQNNYLFTLFSNDNFISTAFVDISTGDFFVAEDYLKNKILFLDNLLSHFSTKELLVSSSIEQDKDIKKFISNFDKTLLMSEYSDWNFELQYAKDKVMSQYNLPNLKSLGLEEHLPSIQAAGAILNYIEETQKQSLSNLKKIKKYNTSEFMAVDRTTIRNLELVANSHDGTAQGSLLSTIDKTITSMGGRLMRSRLLQPLLNQKKINARLNRVDFFYNENILREEIIENLKRIQDLERLATRIALQKANPKELISLKNSLIATQEIFNNMKPSKLYTFYDVSSIISLIEKTLEENPSLIFEDGATIKKGINPELDKYKESQEKGRDWILALEQEEIERTGIAKLKIRFNNVFGYYIEVSKLKSSLVPDNYIRKQTLTNSERYTTQKLQEYESLILGAKEKVGELERQEFYILLSKLKASLELLQKTSLEISKIDVESALAELAKQNNYCKPQLKEDYDIQIQNGRHPVVEVLFSEEQFIPNDLVMTEEEQNFYIITGPNMAGKSTYLRQNALILLMAQIGSFVPASSAKLPIVDKIFTRVGASDNLVRGESTFLVEMQETANILHNATKNSFLIMDEIGRGTSTYDGLSIAWATVEYITEVLQCKTLFATHYHEMTVLDNIKGIKNFNILVKEWNDDIVFLRKIEEGNADKSYGVQVAKLAGIPVSVINRAKQILLDLETNTVKEKIFEEKHELITEQLPLFSAVEDKLKTELNNLDINSITPIEALNILQKWKKEFSE